MKSFGVDLFPWKVDASCARMNEDRPTPEDFLRHANARRADVLRGRLKIYIGMCAGVGKTFSMLSDAIIEKNRGRDVVAGYIEPHGRADTETLALKLESIPFLTRKYRDIELREFDLDAALIRRPDILLVDELAHTNAPDSRHLKRWHDIRELLDAGVNVYTTMNVQHLESLNDVVNQITGIEVHETVPDAFVSSADAIELVDIPPEELLQRLDEGKIYNPEKAKSAASNFFRKGNLIALRELVLRQTAERVDAQMQQYRDSHLVREIWATSSRILVCVAPNAQSTRVVRAAARMAASLHGQLIAVSMESPRYQDLSESERRHAVAALKLAESLGAETVVRPAQDIVGEIIKLAKEKNASSIVVGKPTMASWRRLLTGSIVDQIVEKSGEITVHVIPGNENRRSRRRRIPLSERMGRGTIRANGIFLSSLICAVCTGINLLIFPYFELADLVMIYLLGMSWVAATLGRGEALYASLVNIAAFDFFFVPPRFTLSIAGPQFILTFAIMLVIGMLISSLTLRVRAQATLVSVREARTAALYDLTKKLNAAVSRAAHSKIVQEKIREILHCEGLLFFPNSDGLLFAPNPGATEMEVDEQELAVAQWTFDRGAAAGLGTNTLPMAKGRYTPIGSADGRFAVLAVYPKQEGLNKSEEDLMDALATQIALVLERTRTQEDSQRVQLESEKERLRNTLLSSVSHDFRTPLASITGAASALIENQSVTEFNRLELLRTIEEESGRLSELVRNVLDITKLESPSVELAKEWNSIDELMAVAISRTEKLLGNRRVSLQLPEKIPLLKSDARLLEQVFINLLENIARHTPDETKVNIVIENQADAIIVVFQDTGPGIREGDELQIFEKHYRRRGDSNGLKDEGFGLGLAICKAVMSAHGGSISAENGKDGGAEFRLRFPLIECAPEVPSET